MAQLEEENKHLGFLNSIKQYDEDQSSVEQKENQVENQRAEVHNTTLQELGFGPEEEDDMQSKFLIYSIYFKIH